MSLDQVNRVDGECDDDDEQYEQVEDEIKK